MKLKLALLLLLAGCVRGEIIVGKYDMAEVRDASTLETRVIEDWHQWGKTPGTRQKLVVINLGQWWPGQKATIPLTFVAPATGGPCKNIVISHTGLALKAISPSGSMLRLLKENGVGLVYVGMNTIDAMEPVGKLDVGMKEHLLKTKDMRYTPAWIWGLSDMRALTAALAEKDAFALGKVLVTGGSKNGVSSAAAGIADDRITAILPFAAPIMLSPGGPYVEGMQDPQIVRQNEQFLIDAAAGKIPGTPLTAPTALRARDKIRAFERITVAEARSAGWSEDEMKVACTAAWEVCRTTNYLPALQKRGLEIFYEEGTNDNVGPGLVQLGQAFPNFPMCVVPGAQHGGAKEAGFMKQIGSQPVIQENLYAFAQHHFFNTRPMIATPQLAAQLDVATKRQLVTVTFPDHAEPQQVDLWWSIDRHADYTHAMEYDLWQSKPMTRMAPGVYSADVPFVEGQNSIDLVGVYQHTTSGSTLTGSTPLHRRTRAQD